MLMQAAAGYGWCTWAADVCMVLARVRYSTVCVALVIIHNTNVSEYDYIYGWKFEQLDKLIVNW